MLVAPLLRGEVILTNLHISNGCAIVIKFEQQVQTRETRWKSASDTGLFIITWSPDFDKSLYLQLRIDWRLHI